MLQEQTDHMLSSSVPDHTAIGKCNTAYHLLHRYPHARLLDHKHEPERVEVGKPVGSSRLHVILE